MIDRGIIMAGMSVIAVYLFLLSKKKDYIGLVYLLCFSMIYTEVLKDVFQMPRPPMHGQDVEGYGFPSGHTGFYSMFCIWMFLTYQNKVVKILSIFVLSISCWLLVYDGYHYTRDIIGGLIFAGVVMYAYKKFVSKIDELKKFMYIATLTTALLFVLHFTNGHVDRYVYWMYYTMLGFGLGNLAFIENNCKKCIMIFLTIIKITIVVTLIAKIKYDVFVQMKWELFASSVPLIKKLILKWEARTQLKRL